MNNEKTLLCPLRKETAKTSGIEYFLPCLKKDCAWWNEEEKGCNVAKII